MLAGAASTCSRCAPSSALTPPRLRRRLWRCVVDDTLIDAAAAAAATGLGGAHASHRPRESRTGRRGGAGPGVVRVAGRRCRDERLTRWRTQHAADARRRGVCQRPAAQPARRAPGRHARTGAARQRKREWASGGEVQALTVCIASDGADAQCATRTGGGGPCAESRRHRARRRAGLPSDVGVGGVGGRIGGVVVGDIRSVCGDRGGRRRRRDDQLRAVCCRRLAQEGRGACGSARARTDDDKRPTARATALGR